MSRHGKRRTATDQYPALRSEASLREVVLDIDPSPFAVHLVIGRFLLAVDPFAVAVSLVDPFDTSRSLCAKNKAPGEGGLAPQTRSRGNMTEEPHSYQYSLKHLFPDMSSKE